jgi:hypothetical protein
MDVLALSNRRPTGYEESSPEWCQSDGDGRSAAPDVHLITGLPGRPCSLRGRSRGLGIANGSDDQASSGEEAGEDLPPRLLASTDEEVISQVLEFLGGHLDVVDFKLDTRLRNSELLRPG